MKIPTITNQNTPLIPRGLSKRTSLFLFILILFLGNVLITYSQDTRDVEVDTNGVMRWKDTKEEIKGFGINYGVPFSHSYRSAQRLGVDVKQAIDQDIYHFKRMGFDLFRVHVWDTEISDTLGNLLENEHLDAFDYLVSKLKENKINMVLTPIAFWGNGWPEPDEDTPGFSNKYGKGNSLSNEEAIKAGQNYLAQFLDHVNPYTNMAYKNEPHLVAIEISNEPHHRGEPEKVTEYVEGMVKAVKSTKIKKPIFYNISHGVHFVDAYFDGGVQGGTFQWYPTGLTFQKELEGNLLPNVDDYDIPFDSRIKANKGAKLVYEFDAADVGKSYIYPAMARSFREAGIQIATHFAYDPAYLAPFNTDYNTHYFNLVYTPSKAISMMIVSEIFHTVPLYSDFGKYPTNTTFGDFMVDYQSDLATYNSGEKFYYSNSNELAPKSISELENLAGFGNSKLVSYQGTGAYFMDKLENGVWRLEVMPDAIAVDNPFGRNSPKKIVTELNWKENVMQIELPDLGNDFSIAAINEGNSFEASVENGGFMIYPGTYILSKNGVTADFSPEDPFKTSTLSAFYAPEKPITENWFSHDPPAVISSSSALELTAQFVGPEEPSKVVFSRQGYRSRPVEMEKNGYSYSVEIPVDELNSGALQYHISLEFEDGNVITYPAGMEGRPSEWDFYANEPYRVEVLDSAMPILLFNPRTDASDIHVSSWSGRSGLQATENPLEHEYQLRAEELWREDNENLNAEPIYDMSMNYSVMENIKSRKQDLVSKSELVFKGNGLEKATKIQIALTMDNGSSFGKIITLEENAKEFIIPLAELEEVKTVTLPRPYPSFLPYFFDHENEDDFEISRLEKIQISIGPGLSETEKNESQGIAIRAIYLK